MERLTKRYDPYRELMNTYRRLPHKPGSLCCATIPLVYRIRKPCNWSQTNCNNNSSCLRQSLLRQPWEQRRYTSLFEDGFTTSGNPIHVLNIAWNTTNMWLITPTIMSHDSSLAISLADVGRGVLPPQKGKFLYSAVSGPQDCSQRFYRPAQSNTVLTSVGSIQPYATINARRLLVHKSTTVYSQVLIYTAEWTGTM